MAINNPEILNRLTQARTHKVKAPAKPIAKESLKMKEKKKQEKKDPDSLKKALDKWFDEVAEKELNGLSGCRCMECGEYIPGDYMRSATAHLLPKKIFKSVATHELNYLILGAGCGCHSKSHRVDTFIKMKIWPEASRRIKIMLPLLPVDELRQVSDQLLNALDNTK